MLKLFVRFQNRVVNRQEGQALVEYALILALIAVVSIGVLTLLGTGVRDILTEIKDAIAGAAGGGGGGGEVEP
jgi:pilus assembly protein Flp/PilA